MGRTVRLRRRRPPSSGVVSTSQRHLSEALNDTFPFLGLVFREDHRSSTKRARNRSTPLARIYSTRRWIVAISRYVTRAVESYALTVGIRRWGLRTPATEMTDG